jgi:hypothetical protein
MTIFKLLSAAVIATAMLAAPAMASENHTAKRTVAGQINLGTAPTAHYFYGRVGNSAPRMGALPAPPDGENCDVGDNPFIC